MQYLVIFVQQTNTSSKFIWLFIALIIIWLNALDKEENSAGTVTQKYFFTENYPS